MPDQPAGAPAPAGAAPVRWRQFAPLTQVVGRERELTEVADLLGDRPLVTLTGPPGIGKTRLALLVGAAVEDRFAAGAAFVPLATVKTPELVVSAIAQALEVPEVSGRPLLEPVTRQLADRQTLLVLDNFEQVLDAAQVVAGLLAAAPRLTVLVTSRERLHLSGEQTYPVPPLSLPPAVAALAAGTQASAAVELFALRARSAAYRFTLTPANLPAVAAICRRVDGLPLAIELAAAGVDQFTPQDLLAQLEQQLDVLSDGPRDRPGRQQTLRAAIDWSFTLLDPEDQVLLGRLAVFSGGCTLSAAHAVRGSDAEKPALTRRLAALVDKNLLHTESDPDGQTRYRMLETIRTYAIERLAATGEADAVRDRHAAHVAAFSERAGRELRGPDQVRWMTRFECEHDNLRAALGWTVGTTAQTTPDPAAGTGRAELAARICAGARRFWKSRNYFEEGRRWLDLVLAVPGLEAPLRARALADAASLALDQADHVTSRRFAAEGLRLARELDDRLLVGEILNELGVIGDISGDHALALASFEESVAILRETGRR